MTHNPLSGRSAAWNGAGVDIAEYGYRQELQRGTGRFASFSVAFAFVSVATGIFTIYGAVLNSSGPAGIWTWPIVNSWLYVAIMAAIGAVYLAFLLIRGGDLAGRAGPDLHSIGAELEADAKHPERTHRK